MLSLLGEIVKRKETIERLVQFAQNSPMAFVVWSKKGSDWSITLTTDTIKNITGYSKEEFESGRISYKSLVHKDDILSVLQEVRYNSQKKDINSFIHSPYRIIKKDGTIIWVEVHISIVRDNKGEVKDYEGIIFNCTSKVVAEQSLKERESYINEIEAISGIASAEFIESEKKILVSMNLKTLLNISDSSILLTIEQLEESVDKHDLEVVKEYHHKFLEAMFPYTIEYKVTFGGSHRHIKESVKVVVNEKEPHKAYFSFIDITNEARERKKAESTQKRYEELFNKAPYPIIVISSTEIEEFIETITQQTSDIKEYLIANREKVYSLLERITIVSKNRATRALKSVIDKNMFTPLFIEGAFDTLQELIALISNRVEQYTSTIEFTDNENNVNNMILSFSYDYEENSDIILSFVDITAQIEQQDELSLYYEVVENSPLTIVITDIQGTILYVNKAFTHISGYGFNEAIGQNPRVLKSGLMPERTYEELWETILKGEIWCGTLINRKKDGRVYTEDVRIAPLYNHNGEMYRFVAIKNDITEQLELEEEYRQAQKMESIGRLASGVAHDFNNILTVIKGYVELMSLEDHLSDDMKEDINEIESATDKATHLTRQLLAFSRKEMVSREKHHVTQYLESMGKMLRRVVPENIDFQIKLQEVEDVLLMDPGQIEQIILNLVVNSIDAIGSKESGKIVIENNLKELRSNTIMRTGELVKGNYYVITVIDNGCGMSSEVMEHIFEPFFTTKEVGKGTGLGMATVYGAVLQNGGGLDVSSIVNKGTTFSIYLPLAEEEQSIANSQGSTIIRGDERCLYIEDEESLRRMTVRRLKSLGYSVIDFGSGNDAKAYLDKHADEIDIIITDIVMPNGSGIELGEYVEKEYSTIPVIYTSGYIDASLTAITINLDKSNFIQKPYSVKELARFIRTLLD